MDEAKLPASVEALEATTARALRTMERAGARIDSLQDSLRRIQRIAAMGLSPSADREQALQAILSIAEEQR